MDTDMDTEIETDLTEATDKLKITSDATTPATTSEVYSPNECLDMFRANFRIYRKTLYLEDSIIGRLYRKDVLLSWLDLPHLMFVGHEKSLIGDISTTFVQSIFEELGHHDPSEELTRNIKTHVPSKDSGEIKYYTTKYYVDIPIARYSSQASVIFREIVSPMLSMKHILYGKHIVLLRGMDQVSRSVQSMFLKAMEKYSSTTLFIFTVNQVTKLLPATSSRVMHIRCPLPAENSIYACLKRIKVHMKADLGDDVLLDISKTCGKDMYVATSMMSSYTMVGDIRLFKDSMLKELLSILLKKMLRTKIALNIVKDVRNTYYTLASHNMPFRDMCLTVFNIMNRLRPDDAMCILDIVSEAESRSVIGSKPVLHFERMIYKIYKLTHI